MSNRDATQALLALCESKTRWRAELSAATFRARVVIEDDHAFDGTVEATHHFDIDTYGDDAADALRAIFVDEVFEEATPRLDREVLFDRIRQGLPVFRAPT